MAACLVPPFLPIQGGMPQPRAARRGTCQACHLELRQELQERPTCGEHPLPGIHPHGIVTIRELRMIYRPKWLGNGMFLLGVLQKMRKGITNSEIEVTSR